MARTRTVRPPKVPPIIADSDAMAKAAKAASAVGLTVEELANLLVDSGVAAMPPSDGITARYTLEDMGKRLHMQLAQQPKWRRAEWYAGLAEPQKVAVICHLRNQLYSSEAIAHDFGISVHHVTRTWNEHAADLGVQVVGLRLDTIAGQLMLVSERAQQMAAEAGDHKSVWQIQKDLVRSLQSIGIVDRAIHRVEVTHKMTEDKQSEIDLLLALERKKLRRLEEVKQIECTVVRTDPLPEELRSPEELDE